MWITMYMQIEGTYDRVKSKDSLGIINVGCTSQSWLRDVVIWMTTQFHNVLVTHERDVQYSWNRKRITKGNHIYFKCIQPPLQ